MNWFKRNGLWKTSNPQRGDVIFFRGSDGLACHVGLVSSASYEKVVTIEGNTSSQEGVVANGGCVAKKSYSIYYSRILGYGQPPYAKYESAKPTTPTKPEVKEEDEEIVTERTIVIDGKKCKVHAIAKDGYNYVKLRDFGLAGYSVKYEDNLPKIQAPNTRVVDKIDDTLAKELKEKFGIEDKTIEYIYKYIWGDALVEKLLK